VGRNRRNGVRVAGRSDGGPRRSESYEHGGWSFQVSRGDEGDKFKLDELVEADVQLLGRVTYQGFAKAWPSITDEHGFAEKMNSMPKYVVSSTLTDPEWQRTRPSSAATSQKRSRS